MLPPLTTTAGWILYGHLTVVYNGRANSTLAPGRYLLIHKADGTTLVHGGQLTTPLNYQPAGAKCDITGDVITIRSKKEEMIITVGVVLYWAELTEWSDNKIILIKTEQELQTKLVTNIGDYIPGISFLTVQREAATEVGPCDVLGVDDAGVRHVVELKRHVISTNSVVQLGKYVTALEEYGYKVRGYVAAPTIMANALRYCQKRGFTYVRVEH